MSAQSQPHKWFFWSFTAHYSSLVVFRLMSSHKRAGWLKRTMTHWFVSKLKTHTSNCSTHLFYCWGVTHHHVQWSLKFFEFSFMSALSSPHDSDISKHCIFPFEPFCGGAAWELSCCMSYSLMSFSSHMDTSSFSQLRHAQRDSLVLSWWWTPDHCPNSLEFWHPFQPSRHQQLFF